MIMVSNVNCICTPTISLCMESMWVRYNHMKKTSKELPMRSHEKMLGWHTPICANWEEGFHIKCHEGQNLEVMIESKMSSHNAIEALILCGKYNQLSLRTNQFHYVGKVCVRVRSYSIRLEVTSRMMVIKEIQMFTLMCWDGHYQVNRHAWTIGHELNILSLRR